MGDTVLAYDPKTGKTSTQTVEATYINHDTDLLDVTLRVPGRVSVSNASSSSTATASTTTTAKHSTTATKSLASTTAHEETIHTTANHPWLTADHGWLLAGTLHMGEPVQEADGRVATVEAVRVVPGVASMWDLTVSNMHDFAVGSGAFVVHNCSNGIQDSRHGMPGSDANDFEKQQGADLIKKTDKYVEGYSSDTQWTYQRAEGPHKVANEIDHEARFTQRYFFKFYDEGWDVTRQVSANFDPIERDWEEPLFKWSSGKW